MWNEGTLDINGDAVKFWVKSFEDGSAYGIENENRISKLTMKSGGVVIANYDRGWDVEPDTETALRAYAILLEMFG